MNTMSRREFLDRSKGTSLNLAVGVTILSSAKSVRSAPANDKIVLGIVGCGERGSSLANGFASRDDCEVAYLADVDSKRSESRAKGIADHQGGKGPKCVQDFRKVLDEKSVDAMIIATPDHWHGPATIWSCQAGKDVYVEKPPSHNIWEGRKMVEAARKYNRVVQVGTQSRSGDDFYQARQYIEEGKLGKIHLCKVFDQIGKSGNFQMPPDSAPPSGFDWDMWKGPSPDRKYNNRIIHSGWHYLWDCSGGEIANNGIHQLDIARWMCGVEKPKAASSTGGQFSQKGDFDTPDTQVATWEFDEMIMTFHMSLFTPYMLKTDWEIRQSDMHPYWPQNSMRVEIYGTKGLMYLARVGGGWQVYVRPKNRKPVVKAQCYGRFPDVPHKENFVQCIRSRELPNADIQEGHLSTLLVHYANISYRLGGQKLVIDPKTEHIVDNNQAMKLFKREYRKPWVVEEEV